MRDQLLGYLMDGLGAAERAEVEARLAADPALAADLETLHVGLEPLSWDTEDYCPPAGLAERTCMLVRQEALGVQEEGVEQVEMNQPATVREPVRLADPPATRSAWRMLDAIAAAGLIAAAALIFFPALMHSRNMANLQACQNNLHLNHTALAGFAQTHRGRFPVVPQQGNEAVAGIYAVRLVEGGFITDPRTFLCVSSPFGQLGQPPHVPTTAELTAAQGESLRTIQAAMGGSYGYTLGYKSQGRYHPTRNLGRAHFVLMSDAPQLDRDNPQSLNHGGSGQNVLFEDGHVAYLTSCLVEPNADNFFQNDGRQFGVGLHVDDSVVVPSGVGPELVLPVAAE